MCIYIIFKLLLLIIIIIAILLKIIISCIYTYTYIYISYISYIYIYDIYDTYDIYIYMIYIYTYIYTYIYIYHIYHIYHIYKYVNIYISYIIIYHIYIHTWWWFIRGTRPVDRYMVHGFINFINLAQSDGVKLNQLTTWRPVPVGWVPTWPVFLLGHPRNPQGNLQENPWNSLLKKTSVSYSLVNGYTYIYISTDMTLMLFLMQIWSYMLWSYLQILDFLM